MEQRWFGELELVVFGHLERLVRLGLGNGLDEGFQVTTVAAKFEAIQVDNIGNRVIKEAGVVRDDDGCAVGETSEVVLKPSDVNDV